MNSTTHSPTRREFLKSTLMAGLASAAVPPGLQTRAQDEPDFSLQFIVASCLYGMAPLSEVVPEVHRTGASVLELWAAPHGNQREQVELLGIDDVLKLLDQHQVTIGSFTCFKYGIFNMREEMQLVRRLRGDMVICNSKGPSNLFGSALKSEVLKFAAQLRPHVDFAENLDITIGVENHSGGLINTRDSILWLFEQIDSPRLGLALAPAHLPQEATFIARFIRDLGPRLVHFQAWQRGHGFFGPLPKDQELLQLPHRGPLDWKPILSALKEIHYSGRTEVFMHPWPRGMAILPTTQAVTSEIKAGCQYLNAFFKGQTMDRQGNRSFQSRLFA